MIRFYKNSTNNVVVTLTENSTVSNPLYLFEFINQTSFDKYYFISTDTSNFKQRYNKFSVIEKENADTLNSEVELGFKGRYDYKAYQTDLTSLSGLTTAQDAIPNIVKTVEVGVVDVVMSELDYNEYQTDQLTNIVYQPDEL